MKVQDAICINLPIEEVFVYMSNLENLVDWSEVVSSSRKVSSGERHVGTVVKCTIHILGMKFDTAYEIVECNPNRYLSYKSIMGIATSFTYIRFEPVEGGTQILLENDIHFTGGYLGYDETVITNAISHQIAKDLQ